MSKALKSVDDLGKLYEQIDKLESKAGVIERRIKRSGVGLYSGNRYDANVFRSTYSQLDMEAVRKKLSERWISNHTRRSRRTCLRVTRRKRGK